MKIIKSVFITLLLLTAIVNVKAQTLPVNTAINNVLTAYLNIKNALVADNGQAAQNKAKDLYALINTVPVNAMSAKQQSIWKSYVDKLSFDSRHISETARIEHQREHFASLSKSLYAVLKAFPVNSTAIYWQYCPMKKANWLSEKSTIANPYFGDAMADCGITKETLKAVK